MKINLQGKNIELTQAIEDYVYKRVTNLEKLLSSMEEGGGEAMVSFEVGKNTNHHKSGVVFHCDCLINVNGDKFYSSSNKEDLYQITKIILGIALGAYLVIRSTQIYNLLKLL